MDINSHTKGCNGLYGMPLKPTENSRVTKSDSDANFGNFRRIRNDGHCDVLRIFIGVRNLIQQHRGVSRVADNGKNTWETAIHGL